MSEWPQPGDRVLCVRAASSVHGCVGLLRVGEEYTVAAREDTDWIKGVRLVEVATRGPAPFSVSRFAPVIDTPTVSPARYEAASCGVVSSSLRQGE